MVIVTSLIIISTIDGAGLVLDDFSPGNIIAVLGVLLLFALGIGVLASLVSLHDVHLKLLDEAQRISGVLDRNVPRSDGAARASEQTR